MAATSTSTPTLEQRIQQLRAGIEAVSWSEDEKQAILGALTDARGDGTDPAGLLDRFAENLRRRHQLRTDRTADANLVYSLLYHLCRDHAAGGAAPAAGPTAAAADVDGLRDLCFRLAAALRQAARQVLAYENISRSIPVPRYAAGSATECDTLTTPDLLERLRAAANPAITGIDEYLANPDRWPTITDTVALGRYGDPGLEADYRRRVDGAATAGGPTRPGTQGANGFFRAFTPGQAHRAATPYARP